MNFNELLRQIEKDIKPFFGKGKVVDYIPALAEVTPSQFGIAVRTVDDKEFYAGQAFDTFSIQSISKVFTLSLALQIVGDEIWNRVGKGACETSFNSIVPLENEKGIPRNPFVNAGALNVVDSLISSTNDAKNEILQFIRKICGNETIQYDLRVASSEKKFGYRNAALTNFMKSFGVLENDVSDILDVYFHYCSLKMTCMDVARATLYLANKGYCPLLEEQVITQTHARKINALLMTCGMYEASGDFAFRIGLPGKSGVGGGIFVIVPHKLSICVWAPELDEHGNSLIGIKALEDFIEKTGLSVF